MSEPDNCRAPLAKSEPSDKIVPEEMSESIQRVKRKQKRKNPMQQQREEVGLDENIARLFAVLDKDTKQAAATMTAKEARYLVDAYYIIQEDRKRSDNQKRAMQQEPHIVLQWFAKQNAALENKLKTLLDKYSDGSPVGQWMKSIRGIGPVIAAGFLAHIDIRQAPTVGHIWRFAGLDPTQRWEKGQKRPWNASLKVLCWKASTSFVRTGANADDDYYGKVYRERKAYEQAKNEAGDYAEQAKLALERKKFSDDKAAKKIYESGKLTPGHIDARARRYAVKLFLAHLHEIWYINEYGHRPPFPYPIAVLGHAHYKAPPNNPFN